MDKLVSIIIPTYNIEEYIGECLQSVISQTYKNLEIIVVDDGSKDDTLSEIKKMASEDGRIKVIENEHGGVVRARAAGIDAAAGDFIGFVDGDDYVEPDMYETLVNSIGDADIVSCAIFRNYTSGRCEIVKNKYDKGYYDSQRCSHVISNMMYDFENDMPWRLTPWLVNKLYKREIIQKVNMLETDGITHFEDYCFVLQSVLVSNSLVLIDTPLYHYRYRDSSAIHAENADFLINVGKVYNLLNNFFNKSKYADVLKPQLQKLIQNMTYNGFERNMKFAPSLTPIQFTMDFGVCKEKKIILYGASRCGRDYHKQLVYFGYDIVLWCDSDRSLDLYDGFEISSPETIITQMNEENDVVVLIAVNRQETAEDIKRALTDQGVSENSILWGKPFRVW